MEGRVKRIISIALFTILTHESLVTCFNISSQVDLDSRENEESLNISPSRGSRLVNLTPSAFVPNAPKDIGRRGDLKKRRSNFILGDSPKQPTVINNIHIVVNGNETKPGLNSCTDGICDVSVSSKPDGEGNIVTDVHLTILTKPNTDLQVGDIPVIDGLRGVEDTHNKPPDFYLLNHSRQRPQQRVYSNIPQIQTRHQDAGGPWYQDRRSFQRPDTTWYYHRPIEQSGIWSQGHGRWMPTKVLVDDKIEPPLSKTQPNDE